MKSRLFAALMLLVILLGACSFLNEPLPTAIELRPLPEVYGQGMAISYSGFRTTQHGDDYRPTLAQVREDLEILEGLGFKLIRLYATDLHAKDVLNVIKGSDGGTPLSLKVQLGIWVQGSDALYNSSNMEVLNQGVIWARDSYPEIIVAVSVGNEKMVDWQESLPVPPKDLAGYISYIREKITQPVTTNDNWEVWSLENENGSSFYYDVRYVIAAVDFISLHTYAYWDAYYMGSAAWDYEQFSISEGPDRAVAMMNASLGYTKQNFYDARDAVDALGFTELPIVIGETGWKSAGEGLGHPVNQEMYYELLNDWAFISPDARGPAGVIYFEAFDEPWKGGDDSWGILDVARAAKYVVYTRTESGWGADWTGAEVAMVPFEDGVSDALYIRDPLPPIAVTQDAFTAFAETVPGTSYDATSTDSYRWEAWESNSTAGVALDDTAANGSIASPAEGTVVASIDITPASWGWGMMWLSERQGYDLSGFSEGDLVFALSTNYTGSIEVGFQTGLATDQDSSDVLLSISSGEYGYTPDGSWHEVRIPVATLVAAGAPSFGMPAGTEVNLAKVHVPFVIADRIGSNAAANESAGSYIYVDNIRWEK